MHSARQQRRRCSLFFPSVSFPLCKGDHRRSRRGKRDKYEMASSLVSLSLFLSFFLVKRNRRRRRTEQGPRLIPRKSRNQNVNAEYSTSVAASRNVFSVVLSGKSGSRLVLYYKANIYLSQIAWTWSVV